MNSSDSKNDAQDLENGKFISEQCPLEPLNRTFGFSRGTPIDRYYIENFLDKYKELIRGDVLEIAENTYTKRYGNREKVRNSYILHVEADQNDEKIIRGNFETGEGIRADSMDCIILTQTLQFVFDLKKTVSHIYKMLRENGTALITVSGIVQISRYDMDRWGHYWSFTNLSLQKLLETAVPKDKIIIEVFGNVKAATALLYGLSAEELEKADLDYFDEDYQVTICAVIKK